MARATAAISTLSLHDALPICRRSCWDDLCAALLREPDGSFAHYVRWSPWTIRRIDQRGAFPEDPGALYGGDRKSTRLNSSHLVISYAVFCLTRKTSR